MKTIRIRFTLLEYVHINVNTVQHTHHHTLTMQAVSAAASSTTMTARTATQALREDPPVVSLEVSGEEKAGEEREVE